MRRTILVRGLASSTTEHELLALFEPYSGVVSLRQVGAPGRPHRRCFVRMRDLAAAQRAVHELDGREYNGRVLRIDIVGGGQANGTAEVPSPRHLFQSLSSDSHSGDTLDDDTPLAVSFLVGARAFGHLAENLGLQPRTRVAVEEARERGGIAGMYYFIDVGDDVARDVQNTLRLRSRDRDLDGRACHTAASAIGGRRRSAWYLRPCPRCGGELARASWLTPTVFILQCSDCRWTIPK
jgi:hypothetical protein